VFHTCVIESLGQPDLENYGAFIKTIGDASLLIFSSFKDVYGWSLTLDKNLASMTREYPESLEIRAIDYDDETLDERLKDFSMKRDVLYTSAKCRTRSTRIHCASRSAKRLRSRRPLSRRISAAHSRSPMRLWQSSASWARD
jgi:hypothetical protein